MIVIGFLLMALSSGEILSQNIRVDVNKIKLQEPPDICNGNKRISHMDLLINNMMYEEWDPDENICLEKILNILNNVKNSTLWATWIWDSMQSPTGVFFGAKYQLGNYDQCMKAPWLKTHPKYRTQYCLVDVTLSKGELEEISVDPESSVDVYVNSISKNGVTFNELSLGVCLPCECQSKSIRKFVKVLFENGHLGNAVPEVDIAVDHCQVAGASDEYSRGFYIVVTIFLTIFVLVILGNIIGYDEANTSNSLANKLLRAVCMERNLSYLFKPGEDDIRVLDGMRFIASGIVVGLHVWFVSVYIIPGNSLQIDMDIQNYKLSRLYHLELIVDTFLMMSGLLLIKGVMSIENFNPFVLIAKRYLRLQWIPLLVILFTTKVMVYAGSGPLWPKLSSIEFSMCNKNWWLNLLMLGNYIDTTNICYPILWTVPCDFHLSAVGIMLYWIFTKNKRIGTFVFSTLSFLALIMPGLITYERKLPAAPGFDVTDIRDYRNIILTNPTYIWSHLRAGPYFVGIVAGYILTIYKPINHRKIIPKLWSTLGFVIAFSVAIKVMIMGGSLQDKSKPYNVWESAIFASLNRTIWAIAMAAIIIFCEYGTVPFFHSLLAWKAFIPLSKLSYGVYVLHTMVFSFVVVVNRTPYSYNLYSMIVHTFGVIVISYCLSVVLELFFEAPMANIINMIMGKRSSRVRGKENNFKTGNGFKREENKKIA